MTLAPGGTTRVEITLRDASATELAGYKKYTLYVQPDPTWASADNYLASLQVGGGGQSDGGSDFGLGRVAAARGPVTVAAGGESLDVGLGDIGIGGGIALSPRSTTKPTGTARTC